ncbi:Ig heavy chain Mem5-like isoform X3 [Dicentrarchus labrax]|uniref:Ig heavy chain Mem5-like isoform X3 n=1 Tax=Dicentrarchus labrax TaxID=13489 RepID=UPI0021F56BB4|nr:Ig heavy chain Mem5-like isoform X3 [Dicentrarchus labrax]
MMPLCIFLVLLGEICQVPAVDKTSGITQDSGVITAEVGQTVTLKCYCQDNSVTFLSWYQQSLGGKPLIVSTRMQHNSEATISPAYKGRFQVLAGKGKGINHLVIKELLPSDSATYYCGILEFNAIEFGQGAFLHVKTSLSNIHAVVHQPALETLQWGDSVNLSCTVYAEKCAGEQNLYWFRHGVAQPAIMYHNAGQCMKDSHMENCTLNLAIKSVSSSDAGMYYCALASCGEIVFGQGTKVKIAGSTKGPSVLVYCLSVALAVSIILLFVLALVMYKLKKKICSVCKGTVSHLTCSAASDTTQSQDADALHYAALSLNRTRERHRQEESLESVCVYSRVKTSRVK